MDLRSILKNILDAEEELENEMWVRGVFDKRALSALRELAEIRIEILALSIDNRKQAM